MTQADIPASDPATDPHRPSTSRPARKVPTRDVPTRRVDFGFGEVDLPRHFMGGDIVSSHMVVVLSCLFPEGEDFFVRSVRNYRDELHDPELRRQVAGFIGQEAVHGREHRSFNEALGELGYPVHFLEARLRIGLGLLRRIAPRTHQLALTAALEHYTATLAEILLTTDMIETDTDIEEVRQLFLWHALEENEHKAVAFDVFMQVCGRERVRVNVMRFATFGFLMSIVLGMIATVLTDPASRDLDRLGRSIARFRHNPMVSRRSLRQIRAYNRRDFHPDDSDTTALLAEWREKLFSPEGRMVDKLRNPAAA